MYDGQIKTLAVPSEFLDRRNWEKQCYSSFGIAGNTDIKPQVWTANAARCTSLLNASNPNHFEKLYSVLMISRLCWSHTVPTFVGLWDFRNSLYERMWIYLEIQEDTEQIDSRSGFLHGSSKSRRCL